MPGRKPAALKLLNGRGPGKDAAGREVPADVFELGTAMEPPDWLDLEALEEWERVAPTLERLNIVKSEDRAVFTAYCQTWAIYVKACTQLAKQNLTTKTRVTTDEGFEIKTQPNPLWKIVREAGGELLKFAKEYGLTPVAGAQMAKIRADAKDADGGENPFDGKAATG